MRFSYIRFFGFKKNEFQYFWVFFKKNEYFFGYEDFVDIFGGHHKIGPYLGVISMHFRVFSESRFFLPFLPTLFLFSYFPTFSLS